MPGGGSHLSCSFCGLTQQQVRKLLAGLPWPGASPSSAHAFICDGCTGRAQAALAGPGRAAGGAGPAIRPEADAAGDCSFCHQSRPPGTALAGDGVTRICAACLGRCDGILSAG